MMIRPTELAAIRAGTIDLAFRRWARPRVVVGTRMRTAVGLVEVTSVDEFIAPRAELVASGALTSFYEGELEAVDQLFGTVAHRWRA